jgi:hypothetical protein
VGGYRSKKRRFSPYQIKPKRIVRTGAKITDKTGNPPPDEAGLERAESSSTFGPYTLDTKQRGARAAPETQSRDQATSGASRQPAISGPIEGPGAATMRPGHGVGFYFHWEATNYTVSPLLPDCMLPVPAGITIGLRY